MNNFSKGCVLDETWRLWSYKWNDVSTILVFLFWTQWRMYIQPNKAPIPGSCYVTCIHSVKTETSVILILNPKVNPVSVQRVDLLSNLNKNFAFTFYIHHWRA